MNRRNPYKLFDYYTEADARLFFGREQEISSVIGDILANKLLVLFARSGSGKTSLLNAGIGPSLNDIGRIEDTDPGVAMITVRLSADITPAEAALNAIRESLTGAIPGSIDSLYDALHLLCGPPAETRSGTHALRGVVLVFDQFEEMFISLFKDRADIRQEFAGILAKIIYDTNLRAYVVLSLRSDHFHHLNEFRHVIPNIFQNNTNLELHPFADDAALRVIQGPSELSDAGFSWENGLPARIINDLKPLNPDRDGILPIHLQIVSHGLWESLKPGETVISARHYESRPGKHRLTSATASPAQSMIAERILSPLDHLKGEQRRDLVRLLRELITQHRTKSVRSFDELAAILPQAPLRELLSYLEDKLLLRVETGREKTWYELRHDYLALMIGPWLEQQEKKFERKDLIRRFVIAFCLIVTTALVSKLWYDWNSYYAIIGDEGHEDELVIKRHAAFGLWNPDFWRREILTGFQRRELQASGVPHFQFDVPDALTDWKDIQPHLLENTSQPLRLAANTQELASLQNLENNPAELAKMLGGYNVEKIPEIDLFALADSNILQMLHLKYRRGKADDKKNILSLYKELSQKTTKIPETIIEDAFQGIQDQDDDVKNAAYSLLSSVIELQSSYGLVSLDENMKTALFNTIFEQLENLDDKIEPSDNRVGSLIDLSWILTPDQNIQIINKLLKLLENSKLKAQFTAPYMSGHINLYPESFQFILTINELSERINSINSIKQDKTNWDQIDLTAFTVKNALKPKIELVAGMLSSTDNKSRQKALDLLNQLSVKNDFNENVVLDPRIINVLTRLIDDRNLDIKRSVFKILFNFNRHLLVKIKKEIIPPILGTLNDNSKELRGLSISILEILSEELDSKTARKAIRNILANKDADSIAQSYVAIRALAISLNPEDTSYLYSRLKPEFKNPDPTIGRTAIIFASKLSNKLNDNHLVDLYKNTEVFLEKNVYEYENRSIAEDFFSFRSTTPRQAQILFPHFMEKLDGVNPDSQKFAVAGLTMIARNLNSSQIKTIANRLLELKRAPNNDLSIERFLEEIKPEEKMALIHLILAKPEISNVTGDKLIRLLSKFTQQISRQQSEIIEKRYSPLLDNSIKDDEITSDLIDLAGVADFLSPAKAEKLAAFMLKKDFLANFQISHDNRDDYVIALLALAKRAKSVSEAAGALLTAHSLYRFFPSENYVFKNIRPFKAQRNLTKANWPQSTDELLVWLESDDSKERIFAAYVLAQRKLDQTALERIKMLRNDPDNRPWVKMSALQCLVEIEREKQAVLYEQRKQAEAETGQPH